MNPILFLITKIRLFFAICRKKAAKKALESAIGISQSASEAVSDYYKHFLGVSLKCERLSVEYKRLINLKSVKPLLKVSLPIKKVETTSQSEVILTEMDRKTAIVRHTFGDWGELTQRQWLRNNRIAESGNGVIRSCYEAPRGGRFCIDTCMPSGDTLLHLEGE